MTRYKFPEKNTVFAGRPFDREMLAGVFADIFQMPKGFTGYLDVATGDGTIYFLFFLMGDPYAAGKFTGRKPESSTIGGFFAEITALPAASLTVSLHETDPVLLKCLLVFLQDEPTAKAPVNLIDLEQITRQIRGESADALVVLEKEGVFNFYFFKDGRAAVSRVADTGHDAPSDLSVDEQMLLYAFQGGPAPVVAHIYRTIATEEASDAEQVDRDDLVAMVRRVRPITSEVEPEMLRQAIVTVVAGCQKGEIFRVVLPCTLGRKGCDVVINDSLVSRRHAQLVTIGDEVMIEDLASTNGTFVNNSPVTKQALTRSDLITLGETSLTVSW